MGSWEAQYEKNLREQKMSGPLELTAEHREKNRQLRNIIADLLPIDDEQKLSDCDLLYRFLIGKGWNIKQAEKFLGGYVLLRQVESLNGILREEVEPRVQAMVSSIFGRDKEGYPNLWIALDPTKLIPLLKEMDKSVLLRAQIRVMESARFAAKECGVDRCTYVIDLGLITMSSVNTLTLGFLRDLCKIMQEYYPEIMRRMLIFNTGWAVSGAWKVLRPLVDARVQDKIRFFKGPPNMEKLEPFMDAKEIPQEFGGLGSAEKDTITQLIAAEERRLRREDRGGSSHVDPMPSKRQSSLLQTATEDDEDSLHSACYSIRTPTNSSGASFQYQGDEPMHSSTSSTSNLVCAAGAGDDPALSGCSSTILVASKSVLELLEVDGPLTDIPNIPVPVSSKDKKAAKSANRRSVPTRSSPKRRGAATDEGDPLSCTRSSAGGRSTGSRRRSGASTLAPIQVDLVQCGDGTIAGYHNGRRVGELRQNRIFGDAIVVQGDHEDQGGLIPLQEYNSADGGSFPSAAATTNTTSTTVEDGGEASPYSPHLPAAEVPLPTSRYLMGEILHESGHPIHRVLVVCDSARVPKFVVRQSRFRHLLSIFRVTDSVAERAHIATNARCQHFVRGERVEFGVVRRHKYAPCEDAGAWRMYSRAISTVERVMIPKFLHRRSRRDSSAHSSTGSERDGGGGATARARRSQQRHHVTNSSISSNGSSRMLSPELVKVHAGDVEDGALLAEAKGQSLWFYPPFSETHSMVDLFALALAIGKLWTGGDESDS